MKTNRTTQQSTQLASYDEELFNEKFNEMRRPNLPYGIVINDQPAGILLPLEQLLKAQWINIPTNEELTTVDLTEEVTGLLLTKVKCLLLAYIPEYVRYKDVEDNGELARTFIAPYNEYRHQFDKTTMDVCSEHALLFLDNRHKPLHKIPFIVRFKNVALWSFKAAREKFYQELEKVWSEYHKVPYSGKNDRWRSLGVLNIQFKAVKEGEGRNKSFCCKTVAITTPTVDNLSKLFLGTSKQKQVIWKMHESINGFVSHNLPALTPGPVIEVLPPETSIKKKKLRTAQIEPYEEDNFSTSNSDENEFEELDELSELDAYIPTM